jgi:hypothetical protein
MNFKSTLAAASLSVVSLVASAAHAGTGTGRISATAIDTTSANKVQIYIYGTHSSKPACATSGKFVVDTSTADGKAIYSAILAAALAGRVVEAVGTGNCNLLAGSEGVSKLTFWTDDF